MRNIRIGTRLFVGFGLVLALTAGVGSYAIYEQYAMRQFAAEMDNRDFRVLESLRQLSGSLYQMRAKRDQALIGGLLRKQQLRYEDPTVAERDWVRNKDQDMKALTELEATTASYENSALSLTRASQWRDIRFAVRQSHDALNALVPEVEALFGLINSGDIAGAVAQLPAAERQAFDEKLTVAQRETEEQMAIGRAEIEAFYNKSRTSVAAGLIAAVLAGLLAASVIQRSITHPLAAFMAIVERVGKGDLTEQAAAERRDELGDLARSLNRMVAGLRGVASETRVVAENLNAATAEILASTQQQAAATAEQAAAVHQASATIAEISQSGAQISERARQVAAAAEATSSASTAGLDSVQLTAATMESIREQAEAVAEHVIALSEKTQAIGEIVATVNDLAEQSHLLALNAAIEAAAAGEYGRSFAVVATEMKNLADQSKQATVQVRSILGDVQKAINSSVMLTEEAVKRVESGRQQAELTGRTIHALSGNIQESVQAFQQIVAGNGQQQIGVEQVTQAFRSIGIASEQTANSTRQSEKAAANLNALGQQLRAAVETYRI